MKDIIRYAVLLFIVGGVCAALVVITYNIADPILVKREAAETEKALDSLYEGSEYTYDDISADFNLDAYDALESLYYIESESGISYVYKITTPGKNGNIVYLIEIDENSTIKNIAYISQKETPGRGDKITLPNFTDQIIGSNIDDFSVDTISGATISSSAVINSTSVAIDHYESEVK